MKRSLIAALAVALVLCAAPALAQSTIPLDASASRAWTGGCTYTGSHAGATVPRCTGTADGSFLLRYQMRTGTAAPTCTVNKVSFTTVGDPSDVSAQSCFSFFCTATVEGANPNSLTYNSGSTLTYNMVSDSCITPNRECVTGAAAAANVRNLNAGADCASGLCTDAELIVKVQYNGTAGTGCTNGFTGGVDLATVWVSVN